MLAPFALSNFGPSGVCEEEKGIMLSEAPESTKKFNWLYESLKNIKRHRRCCVNLMRDAATAAVGADWRRSQTQSAATAMSRAVVYSFAASSSRRY